jgi:predicted RNA-binding protein
VGSKALITQRRPLNFGCKMCEFNVILDGKTLFKDVVYARTEGATVIVKNVLGEAKEFENCKISEVDVNSTRLVLTNL